MEVRQQLFAELEQSNQQRHLDLQRERGEVPERANR
jgi:hypothetical protein